jgi:RNA polymerase sigma factor (sigma-70 family)
LNNIELIERCQQGDRSSYSELYLLYSKNALGTAYLISGSKGIAEDILQETFIECFNKVKDLKNLEAFEVWFYKILTRTGWRMVKKHNNVIPIEDDNLEGLLSNLHMKSEIEESETGIMVGDALDQLSMPLKTVVILYFYNDMTIKEIARVLGCFEGTVKSRLYNAKKKLYEILNNNECPKQAAELNICK